MSTILRNRNGFPVPVAFRHTGFEQPLEQLFDSMLQDFFAPGSPQEALMSSPKINVVETPQAYEVEAELPGVTKNDVKIAINSRHVSIEAEVKRDSARKEGEAVIHAERMVKKFARSFTLAAEVDDAQAVAKLENGVLILTLPKKEARQAKQIQIQ